MYKRTYKIAFQSVLERREIQIDSVSTPPLLRWQRAGVAKFTIRSLKITDECRTCQTGPAGVASVVDVGAMSDAVVPGPGESDPGWARPVVSAREQGPLVQELEERTCP